MSDQSCPLSQFDRRRRRRRTLIQQLPIQILKLKRFLINFDSPFLSFFLSLSLSYLLPLWLSTNVSLCTCATVFIFTYVFCQLCSYMYLPTYVSLFLPSLWLSTNVSFCTCATVFQLYQVHVCFLFALLVYVPTQVCVSISFLLVAIYNCQSLYLCNSLYLHVCVLLALYVPKHVSLYHFPTCCLCHLIVYLYVPTSFFCFYIYSTYLYPYMGHTLSDLPNVSQSVRLYAIPFPCTHLHHVPFVFLSIFSSWQLLCRKLPSAHTKQVRVQQW